MIIFSCTAAPYIDSLQTVATAIVVVSQKHSTRQLITHILAEENRQMYLDRSALKNEPLVLYSADFCKWHPTAGSECACLGSPQLRVLIGGHCSIASPTNLP